MPSFVPRVTNPLPQLVPQRVLKFQRRLRQQAWTSEANLSVEVSTTYQNELDVAQAKKLKYQPIEAGTHFGDPDAPWQTVWFRVRLPKTGRGEKGLRHLIWRCQGEATLFIDGKPWAGLDVGHPSCQLPESSGVAYLACGTWNTGIWVPNTEPINAYGPRFDSATLGVRNEDAWQASIDFDVLCELLMKQYNELGYPDPAASCNFPAHDKVPHLFRILCQGLDEACDAMTVGGVGALRKKLAQLYKQLPAESWAATTSITGHAHIDLVWLWPESASVFKAAHSFATAARLLERYPDATFNQSQPAMNRWMEQASPDSVRQIKKLIKTGQWEVLGGFEAESDVNLPCGEALLRSLRCGQKKTKQLTGEYSEICWLPDVFGYSQCLPQILAAGGVKYFYTTKMTWSAITRFPYTSFKWRGNDGTQILAHLAPFNYNGTVDLKTHCTAIEEHRQTAAHPETLLGTGYGDGGGGMTETMCERAKRLTNLATVPKTKWSTAADFFARMNDTSSKLPTYQGELYLEYHRGTYTTQSDFKRLYRRAESTLLAADAASVVAKRKAIDEKHWQRVAFAQFHDAIPGSSIPVVYRELNAELESIGDTALNHTKGLLESGNNKKSAVAFNALPVERSVVVEHRGKPRAITLAPLASAAIADAETTANPLREASATRLNNNLVDAKFDARGNLRSLTIDGEKLDLANSPRLRMFEDEPAAYDAWDIDHSAGRLGIDIAPGKLKLVEQNEARAVLRSETVKISNVSSAIITYTLEANSRHLHIDVDVDWHDREKLLRLHVPTNYNGRYARFGSPFGSVDRVQHPEREEQEAQWEVPGSRWAAVLDDTGRGLSLLTEAKFGFACRDGDLGVSLLRGSEYFFPDHTMPRPADEPTHTDQGHHHIKLALGRYEPTTQDETQSTALAADALFAPVVTSARGRTFEALFHWHNLGGLVPVAALPAETGEGYVLRLHETAGQKGKAILQLTHEATSVQRVDLFENASSQLKPQSGNRYAIAYKPYELISLLVR